MTKKRFFTCSYGGKALVNAPKFCFAPIDEKSGLKVVRELAKANKKTIELLGN